MRFSFLAAAFAALAGPALAHDPISWQGSTIHVLLDKEMTGGEMGMFTTHFVGPDGPGAISTTTPERPSTCPRVR